MTWNWLHTANTGTETELDTHFEATAVSSIKPCEPLRRHPKLPRNAPQRIASADAITTLLLTAGTTFSVS